MTRLKDSCGRDICDLFLSNFEGILLTTEGTNCSGVKMVAVEEIEGTPLEYSKHRDLISEV